MKLKEMIFLGACTFRSASFDDTPLSAERIEELREQAVNEAFGIWLTTLRREKEL